jgi:EAL domain-containing protein (putative c-di-GMP-specific phosphodiesterase class I)
LLKTISHIGGAPRVRHAAIAIVAAAFLALITILRPIDIAVWSLQSKLFEHEPSGEIVLVSDFSRSLNGTVEHTNEVLAEALVRLRESDAELIVVQTPLRASKSPELDARLKRALVDLGDRVVVAEPSVASPQRQPNSQFFDGIARRASSDLEPDFLGVVWGVDSVEVSDSQAIPSVWRVLAGSAASGSSIWTDYTISTESIPKFEMTVLAQGRNSFAEKLTGKKLLISNLGGDGRQFNIPDQDDASVYNSGELHVLAAETALRGAGHGITSIITLPFFGIVLILIVALKSTRNLRRVAYGGWLGLWLLVLVLSSKLGARVYLAEPLMLGAVFAVQRMVGHWRRRHLYTDARSGLPNFAALHRDLEISGNLAEYVIVVAKIARLDGICATIGAHEQGEYLRQIATRLSLGEQSKTIYHDGGKYLAMVLHRPDYPDLQAHLEGLRAVVSQAVSIAERALDVSITFGVDQSSEGRASNRISSAIAAADQAREAYRPVFVISDFEADSESWDYSLQARLEDALSENRISIKLQPKVEMQSGLLVGAEALARWTDRERGEIPPNRFILQCERSGRLDELTKRVMQRSFAASRELEQAGLPARISVNVSAIQFVDSRIVELTEEALALTSVAPENVMIEITETARIDDMARARDIMEQIGRFGIDFSIDDFGVGSGNLDALYSLPFRELKIDRMFTNSVSNCRDARTIVEALMRLSRDLGLASVAEGIDNPATFELLRDMGGDLAQGFLIARPLPLAQLKETLRLQGQGGLARGR